MLLAISAGVVALLQERNYDMSCSMFYNIVEGKIQLLLAAGWQLAVTRPVGDAGKLSHE